MAETLTITVKAEDIAAGLPRDPNRGALAAAVKRQTGARAVSVDRQSVCIGQRTLWLPPEGRRFVDAFDAYGGLMMLDGPFEFVLTYDKDVDHEY